MGSGAPQAPAKSLPSVGASLASQSLGSGALFHLPDLVLSGSNDPFRICSRIPSKALRGPAMASLEYSSTLTSPGCAWPPRILLVPTGSPAFAAQERHVAFKECEVLLTNNPCGAPVALRSLLTWDMTSVVPITVP